MSAKKRKRDPASDPPDDKAIDSAFGKGDQADLETDAGAPLDADRPAVQIVTESDAEEPDLDAQVKQLADRNLRLQAEMENVRQRAAREITEERRYAAMPLIRDLLDVVDNIQRAVEAADAATDADSLREGFRLVAQQLQTTLAKHHCTPIEAEGTPFDPSIHEAIQQMPSAEQPAGHVMLVTQVGYLLNGRVVRPSQVIVSTGPSGQ